jgi:hypothetical protein
MSELNEMLDNTKSEKLQLVKDMRTAANNIDRGNLTGIFQSIEKIESLVKNGCNR